MKLCENEMVCKLKDGLCKLSKYKVKENYDISLSLVNEEDGDEGEQNTHVMKGSVECKLVKLLAIFGLVALTLAAVKSICDCLFGD